MLHSKQAMMFWKTRLSSVGKGSFTPFLTIRAPTYIPVVKFRTSIQGIPLPVKKPGCKILLSGRRSLLHCSASLRWTVRHLTTYFWLDLGVCTMIRIMLLLLIRGLQSSVSVYRMILGAYLASCRPWREKILSPPKRIFTFFFFPSGRVAHSKLWVFCLNVRPMKKILTFFPPLIYYLLCNPKFS